MPDWNREIQERLRASKTSPEIENDLAEEIAGDLEERYREAVASGRSPEDAERWLRSELDGEWLERRAQELTRRDARRRPEPPTGQTSWLSPLWYDVRFGLRGLRLNRSFTVAALISLALGIGATTAIFQLLDALRLRSLPVSHPEQLVEVHPADMNGLSGNFYFERPVLSDPIWRQLQKAQQTLDDTFAWSTQSFNAASSGEMKLVEGLQVTGNFFSALGLKPAAGRLIVPADDVRGCGTLVAVLSHAYWTRAYGAANDAIGKTITLERNTFQIVGVAPAGFFGLEIGHRFDVAIPLCAEPRLYGEANRLDSGRDWWLTVMGRLKPGVTLAQATAQLEQISGGIFATVPSNIPPDKIDAYKATKLHAYRAATGVSELRESYSGSLWLLLGIAAFVMLISCVNLANLMLARASAREREFAIRLALGASRYRLLRQLMTESVLLAFCGAALGFLLAVALSRGMLAFLQTKANPIFLDTSPDYRVLAFTIAIACVTCLMFGLAPAWRATQTDPGTALKPVGRTVTGGTRGFTVRRGLVAAQVALSAVLVIAALLFTQSLRNLLRVDPGFEQKGLLVAAIDLSPLKLPVEQRIGFKQQMLERICQLPGIEDCAKTAIRPLSGGGWNNYVWMEREGRGNSKTTWFNMVSPSFFSTVGIPLIKGRLLNDGDKLGSPPVAVVNEAFVRAYSPGVNPIGMIAVTNPTPNQPWTRFEIVGVVKDTKYSSLKEDVPAQMFLPAAQDAKPSEGMQIIVRTRIGTADTFREMNAALASVAPGSLVYFVVIREQVEDNLLRERMMATLSLIFGVLATVLAVVGLYGVITYSVARRTNEIGVRVALGATRSRIMQMILGEGGRLIIAGLVVGVAAAIGLGRLAAAMLFGLKPRDPLILGGACLLLFLAGMLATAVPAVRAANLNPMAALREE